MKTRIIALILTVVMSLLALASCGSFNFAEEDFTSYAEFNYDEFVKALGEIQIEDGDFTTDEATREKMVASKVYNTIVDKILAPKYESDRKVEGKLGAGDVLYFVYYAVDADNNVFFGSEMKESAVTSTSTTTAAKHVIRLGETNQTNKLFEEIKKNLVADVDVKDYIYSTVTSSDVSGDDLKIKAGDIIVVSYTRTYTDAEGNKITESAAYERIELVEGSTNPLVAEFLKGGADAKLGADLKAVVGTNEDGSVKTDTKFNLTIGDITYEYSAVKAQWKEDGKFNPIATFKYTSDKEEKVTPDSLHANNAEKINLKDKELTYYVFPVNYVTAPSFDEITASDILVNVYASALKETSFEAFENKNFANGSDKLETLLQNVADIYDTKKENNEYYKADSELKTLLDAYDKAKTDGGSKPTTE